MKVQSAGKTDIGRVRSHNEDSILVAPDQNLFAVADGLGGHSSGEVASRLAIEILLKCFTAKVKPNASADIVHESFSGCFTLCNDRILEKGRESDIKGGMGTTLTAAWLDSGKAHICHIGDSRAYLVHDGSLSQVTDDHSWVYEQYKSGKMSLEQANSHFLKNVVTRSLGFFDRIEPDQFTTDMAPGDSLLLCSDGLTNMLSDDILLSICSRESDDLNHITDQLIASANTQGGKDNISAVIIRNEGD